jgi:hypothetical protein
MNFIFVKMVQISLTNSLSPSSSLLKWYEEDACLKVKPLQANTTIYSPWNYTPNGVTSSFNYIQGIGAGTSKNTFTIVGTYGQLDNGAVGVVYQGSISKESDPMGMASTSFPSGASTPTSNLLVLG